MIVETGKPPSPAPGHGHPPRRRGGAQDRTHRNILVPMFTPLAYLADYQATAEVVGTRFPRLFAAGVTQRFNDSNASLTIWLSLLCSIVA